MGKARSTISARQIRLCYVVNNAAFFVSHRLPLAQEAKRLGFAVDLLTGQPGSDQMEADADHALVSLGMRHRRCAFTASGINPAVELWGLLQLTLRLLRMRPDLLHCASPKGVLYGGIAGRLAGVRCIVLSVTGLGFAFTPTDRISLRRRFVGWVYSFLARLAYGHPNKRVIVQNRDDEETIVQSGLATQGDVRAIAGSGVALAGLIGATIEDKSPIVLFPARILVDKGVVEFVDAARQVKARAPGWRFLLAGAADYRNPTSVSRRVLDAWQEEGIVELLGHVKDMRTLYESASIVCLPSYREGLPKALLEAAAAGCAVVTTDAVGCREAIVPGLTGDLVPIGDRAALATALCALMEDRERREQYGRAGRALAIERFDIGKVVEETFAIYTELLTHD